MSQRNEIVDILVDELDRYGLRSEVSNRSKHVEVAWETPLGRRFVIAPCTSSDWRAGFNARSQLRRMLKQDNLQPRVEASTSFQKAMALPKEPVVSVFDRERFLKQDVEALADLVMDLQNQLVSLQQQMTTATVTSTVTSIIHFGAEQKAPNEAVPEKAVEEAISQETVIHQEADAAYHAYSAPLGKTSQAVFDALTYRYEPRHVIISRTQLDHTLVNQALMRLRKKGLVESGLRGMWRKVPKQ